MGLLSGIKKIAPLALAGGAMYATAGSSLLPSVIAGGASILGGQLGNASSAKEAKKNREFQERMSNTAHQRETNDLEKAGLNRILSVTNGGGASTPSGATAQQKDPISTGVTTALQAMRLKSEIENIKSSTIKNAAETELTNNKSNQTGLESTIMADALGLYNSAKNSFPSVEQIKKQQQLFDQTKKKNKTRKTWGPTDPRWNLMKKQSKPERDRNSGQRKF